MVAKLQLFSDTATKINKKSRKQKTSGSLILKNPPPSISLPPSPLGEGPGERLENFEVLEAILTNFVKSFTYDIRLLNEITPQVSNFLSYLLTKVLKIAQATKHLHHYFSLRYC